VSSGAPEKLSLDRRSLLHVVRTTLTATIALLLAQFAGLPEAYWAAVAALIVMQSTLGAALQVSLQRFAGTVLGAALGAVIATLWGRGPAVFGAGVLAGGGLCALLRLDRAAYRFAGVTLAIVVLARQAEPAWIIALHRFVEVTLGIVVGLFVTAAWPEA
jgi:uncharacterized membrane protein YgaE (UPF0421/DUF939 family)